MNYSIYKSIKNRICDWISFLFRTLFGSAVLLNTCVITIIEMRLLVQARVTGEVMNFYVAHIDSARDFIHLIKLASIVSNIGVISNSFPRALEVNGVHFVEANQCYEQPHIGQSQRVPTNVSTLNRKSKQTFDINRSVPDLEALPTYPKQRTILHAPQLRHNMKTHFSIEKHHPFTVSYCIWVLKKYASNVHPGVRFFLQILKTTLLWVTTNQLIGYIWNRNENSTIFHDVIYYIFYCHRGLDENYPTKIRKPLILLPFTKFFSTNILASANLYARNFDGRLKLRRRASSSK